MPTWYAVHGILIFRKHGVAFGLEPRGNGLFECVHLAEPYAQYLEAIESRREEQRARRVALKAVPQQFGPPGVAEPIRLAVNRLKRRERQARKAGDHEAADAHRGAALAFLSRWYDQPARDHRAMMRLLYEATRLLRVADRLDALCAPLEDVADDLHRCEYDPLLKAIVDRCRAELAARPDPVVAAQRILANVSASLGPKLWDAIRLSDRHEARGRPWRTEHPLQYAALRPSPERIERFRAVSIRVLQTAGSATMTGWMVALLVVLLPTAGGAYCTAPSAPYCATRYGAFDDADEFERCKRQMTSYKADVETFLACQRDASNQAVTDFNDAVARFNRRARG